MSDTVIASHKGKRHYALAEKLRMVEATLEPGASVARVAQAHGVNPNLIFVWRKQHREGRLVPSNKSETRLLPVAVTDALAQTPGRKSCAASTPASTLHVELPRGRVRIEGSIDPASLRVLLEMLLR